MDVFKVALNGPPSVKNKSKNKIVHELEVESVRTKLI